MANKICDIGVARQIGTYSDAVAVPAGARWLYTAGTPGLSAAGMLPSDIVGQTEVAWINLITILEQADMTVHDLVVITQYLLKSSDIPAYAKARAHYLGDARPASMLLVVPALVRPDFLLEISACAAKVDDKD
jgi:2-iminobutanoate/2-iminopropanoate deaminase